MLLTSVVFTTVLTERLNLMVIHMSVVWVRLRIHFDKVAEGRIIVLYVIWTHKIAQQA